MIDLNFGRCVECRYWDPFDRVSWVLDIDEDDGDMFYSYEPKDASLGNKYIYGNCKRYAPKPTIDVTKEGYEAVLFPKTHGTDDCCCEFSPDDNMKTNNAPK